MLDDRAQHLVADGDGHSDSANDRHHRAVLEMTQLQRPIAVLGLPRAQASSAYEEAGSRDWYYYSAFII